MARPSTKGELITYIKRRLGEPVIVVDVAPVQIIQRIDDALSVYQDYHYDAAERIYLKRQITASNLEFTTDSTGTFANGEYFIGQTSNVYGKVHTQPSANLVQFTYRDKPIANTFQVGETVVGVTSNATGVIGTITLGDLDNEYLPTSNNITSVFRVLQYNGGIGGERGSALFSTTFPLIASDIQSLTTGAGDLVGYFITKSHLELLNDLLVGDINVRFNRHANRVYLDVNWPLRFTVGDWVVMEAQQNLDPAEYSDIWGDRWLCDYATALTKKQWGQNLIKFEGTPMTGGITLNGKQIYDEGVRESKELEDAIQAKFEVPPGFLVC